MDSSTVKDKQELQLIQRAYRKLLRSIQSDMDDQDRKNIRNAYEIAVDAHKSQRRKSGEPYILHPIEVARICAQEVGLGPTAIVAALLHDVVEDTEISLDEINKIFGPKITRIVDGLTKMDNLFDVASPQAHNFRKILRTLSEDVRVVLIKMADRLHNMRTLGSMPQHKQLKIASETAFIYGPLAHRLGLYAMKTEFEDLCMKITEPDTYQHVAQKLKETKKGRMRYVNSFMQPIKEELDKLDIKYRISGRAKSIFSIANKIKKKKVAFEQIYDLFAIRIIVDIPIKQEKFVCWQIYSIITDFHKPIPERLKDWISTPKSNGYESLHTTVVGPKGKFVEVQIRSERMDEIAEKGFAAHWKYKGQLEDNVYDTWFARVREMLENPVDDAIDFLNDFRSNLFAEEVYVFTPKGEMRTFPKGATGLDFAFDIHSEVGCRCIGIKVDERQVPMSYKLKNGDRLKVVTSKNQKPSESWLQFVFTGKAKSKIRTALKEDKKKLAEFGKETLQRKMRKIKADFTPENMDRLAKHYQVKSHLDLFHGLYTEQLSITKLKDFTVENGKLMLIEVVDPTKVKREVKNTAVDIARKGTGKPRLMINGESAEHLAYSLASCCRPVQGDNVFAYTTTHDGIKIHRMTCPNADNMLAKYGYRVMKAEWVSSFSTSFVADLVINGIDDIGVVQRLTNVLTNVLRVNMRSISMDGKAGYYEGRISVVVNNTSQLNFIIKTLMDEESVSSVTRVD